jgi:ornithine cyclodeaminase
VLIDAAAIRETLTMAGLIASLAMADRSRISSPARAQHHVPGGVLLTMPAWSSEFIGLKTVTIFPANAASGLPTVLGQYLLMSARSGEPVAVIDGSELTLWRTAAVAALASSRLAQSEPREVLIVGTGALASYLVEAFRVTHPDARLRLWGRDRDRAASLGKACGVAHEPGSLEAAARGADVICCATSSTEPLIEGNWLKQRSVLILMGSFSPEMREADDLAIRDAAVFVDAPAALAEAGELASLIARGDLDAGSVGSLSDLLVPGFMAPSKSVFKSIGNAENDLIAATHLVQLISPGASAREALAKV